MGTADTFATRDDPLLVKTGDGCPLPLRRFGPRDDDAAPPVLLLAGADGAMRWWRALLPALCIDAAERRLLAPLAPREAFDAAHQVVTWDARGLFDRPVHLVGHGLGGLAAAVAAIEGPESVASLTLLGTPSSPDGVATEDLTLCRPAAVRRALSPRWSARHRRVAAALENEASVAAAWTDRLWGRAVGPSEFWGDVSQVISGLAAVGCPILVIHGSCDAVVPIRQARTLVRSACAATRLLELDGGHLLPVECAPEIASAVAAHVAAAARR